MSLPYLSLYLICAGADLCSLHSPHLLCSVVFGKQFVLIASAAETIFTFIASRSEI